MNAVISNTSSLLFSLPVIFVLDKGEKVRCFCFGISEGLCINSRKWEGHDFFRQKNGKYPGPPNPIKNVPSLNVQVSFQRKPPAGGGWGVLASFYNGLYGKTPPERGIFFRLQVYLKEKGFQ